jgi:hypothetical protein
LWVVRKYKRQNTDMRLEEKADMLLEVQQDMRATLGFAPAVDNQKSHPQLSTAGHPRGWNL